jgi:hypothetical protein
VHVIALIPKRLTKPDLATLRTAATAAAMLQRTARDVALAQEAKEQEVEQGWER